MVEYLCCEFNNVTFWREPRFDLTYTNRLQIQYQPITHLFPSLSGSPKPNFPDDGVLRLFAMRYCPFVHRVHLVLQAKNIPYHTYNINLESPPEWYAEINPNGKVPALQLVNEPNSPILVESLLITEYLDDKYPQNPLYSKVPLTRAQDKLFCDRLGALKGLFYRLVTEKDDSELRLFQLTAKLSEYEDELKQRGTQYFSGERIGILDYAIWPAIERMDIVPKFNNDQVVFTQEKHPTLVSDFVCRSSQVNGKFRANWRDGGHKKLTESTPYK